MTSSKNPTHFSRGSVKMYDAQRAIRDSVATFHNPYILNYFPDGSPAILSGHVVWIGGE